MKLIHLIGVVVRLFAICLVLFAMQQFIHLHAFYSELEIVPWFNISLISSMIIISILLWFFPMTVASGLSGHRNLQHLDDLELSPTRLMDTLFIVLGFYFLYGVLTDTAYWLYLVQYLEGSVPEQELSGDQRADIFATMVQAILVLILLFGRISIYRMISKVRYGG